MWRSEVGDYMDAISNITVANSCRLAGIRGLKSRNESHDEQADRNGHPDEVAVEVGSHVVLVALSDALPQEVAVVAEAPAAHIANRTVKDRVVHLDPALPAKSTQFFDHFLVSELVPGFQGVVAGV